MCALGVGILREIFRNMMVTVTTGTKGLTISMTKRTHTHTHKKTVLSQELEDAFCYRASTVSAVHKTEFIHYHVQVHTAVLGTLHMHQMWYQAGLYRRIFHLSMLHFLKTIFSVVNSLCCKESRTVNFVIVWQYREKGIKLKYKMTYQICLTGTNSLWSIPHHNFIGRETIHIYKSGSRLLLFCL